MSYPHDDWGDHARASGLDYRVQTEASFPKVNLTHQSALQQQLEHAAHRSDGPPNFTSPAPFHVSPNGTGFPAEDERVTPQLHTGAN